MKIAWQAGAADNIGIVAAGIAHYALLALVPALGALVLTYGLVADPQTVGSNVQFLAQNLPASAADLISDQLKSVSEGASGTQGLGLVAALAVAMFGARNAARSLMTGLSIVFGTDEDRSFMRGNMVAVAITAAGLGGLAAAGLAGTALSSLGSFPAKIGAFALLASAAWLAAALLYRFAPNGGQPQWPAIWPAAIIFSLLWLVATATFALYAANFGSYNATYGALGAVIALITWFWVTAFLLLLCAELSSLLGQRG